MDFAEPLSKDLRIKTGYRQQRAPHDPNKPTK